MWHKIIILGVVVCFFALLQSCSFDQIAQDVVPDDDGMGMDTSSVDTSNMMSNCNPDTEDGYAQGFQRERKAGCNDG
nr:hypothetical protein [Saprospiraceae bacterium]